MYPAGVRRSLDSLLAVTDQESVPSGIARAGRLAERLFCEITGATLAAKASGGDAWLDGHLVEIKQTSGPFFNLNQVRAFKYLVLVVYCSDSGHWHVVPAHEIVRAVCPKAGQHALNPFECARLSLTAFRTHCVTSPEAELRSTTLLAVEQSQGYPQLDDHMKRLRKEAVQHAVQSREAVRATLGDEGLL